MAASAIAMIPTDAVLFVLYATAGVTLTHLVLVVVACRLYYRTLRGRMADTMAALKYAQPTAIFIRHVALGLL